MANSKFEFTGEVKTLFGITLRRIKAIKAFSNVEAGEVGGWIEKETNLEVYGDAWVYGNAWDKSPLYIQGTKHYVVMYDSKRLKIGCQIYSMKQWLAHGERIGRANGYTDAELAEYRLYVELAAKRYGVTESEDDINE